jgi:hypothetical protein
MAPRFAGRASRRRHQPDDDHGADRVSEQVQEVTAPWFADDFAHDLRERPTDREGGNGED